MRYIFILFAFFLCIQKSTAQQEGQPLSYYLPNSIYDPGVPTPESYFGWQMGKWHVSHDQLVGYMKVLAASSKRVQLIEYGKSHEERPMLCLYISAEQNIENLDALQKQRQKLLTGEGATDNQMAVAYMGYSIHGDEASGSNAAPMVAYYLAAALDPYVTEALEQTLILLDPCFNPDGLNRYASWVNGHKSKYPQADKNTRQLNEAWPTGRTNHYWFDLNRDWLVGQQPESKGRIELFHKWLPNVLTDHHEMGSSSTFFFQPGIPSRVNPLTPQRNQDLTKEIAQYHADILDKNGIYYFTGERYDDFYYGKGSTFPDINGSVGILFEQASSNGSMTETPNGLMDFPFTIRNQVFTSLSTFKALTEKRRALNAYMKDFYKNAKKESKNAPFKGFVFGGPQASYFLELLLRHEIEVHAYEGPSQLDGQELWGDQYIVKMEQPRYCLLYSMLERRSTFPDSLFYDISAWTLPLAFDLDYQEISKGNWNKKWLGQRIEALPSLLCGIFSEQKNKKTYAWLLDWNQYEAPAFLNAILAKGIRAKVAEKEFVVDGKDYTRGTIFIPNNQRDFGDSLAVVLDETARKWKVRLEAVYSGYASEGPSLGSNTFRALEQPKTLLLTGNGVNSYAAGTVWHLLDTRHGMPPVLVDVERSNRIDFTKYNVLLMPEGSFGRLSVDKVKAFLGNGGTIVASGNALKWLSAKGFAALEYKAVPRPSTDDLRPYDKHEHDHRAFALPGAIFQAELDLTHPLAFGFRKNTLPIFLGSNLFLEATSNAYATPVRFAREPLLAGYVHRTEIPLLSEAGAAVVAGSGRGKIICLAGDPNFRGFWYGTNRLYMNAVFFGQIINSQTTERN